MVGNLTLALRTAQSGLLVNQAALEVTANNVANVSTEGYSRKIADIQSRVVDGNGTGVELGRISRSVDEGLLKTLRREISTLNALELEDQYFSLLEETFGTLSDNSSISHILEEFGISLEALVVSPEKYLEQSEVVRWADETSNILDSMSGTIQDLRLQADRAIAEFVTEANKLISSIGELNDKIVRNLAVGNNVTDMEDQRDKAIDDLSKIIDISYYPRSTGDIIVFTTGGNTLVDNQVATLSHAAASSTDPTVTYAEGDFAGITVTVGASSFDITENIRDGSLKTLIDMRDNVLPNLQSQLDELSGTLRDTINQIHNQGSAFPGLQTLTGTRNFALSASQTIQLDPTNSVDDVTIALFDSSGDQQASTTLNTIMVSAIYGTGAQASHGAWTIDEVAASIQDWLQANGASSASVAVNSDDKFVIELNSTSVYLSFRDETASANGSTLQDAEIKFDADGDGTVDETVSGFSYFFGLNDFFVDTLNDETHDSNVLASTFTTSAGTLRFTDDSGLISSLAVSAGTSLTDLATSISALTNLTADVIPDGSGYRLRISHDVGNNLIVTQSAGTILTDMGIQVSNVRTSSRLQVRTDIQNDPGLISTGSMQWDSTIGASGEYFSSIGSNDIIVALAEKFNSKVAFDTAGGLAGISNEFTEYASTILARNASLADKTQFSLTFQTTLTNNLQNKSDNFRGVNLDEEMSNLILFEMAYSASARIIATVQRMLDALERVV